MAGVEGWKGCGPQPVGERPGLRLLSALPLRPRMIHRDEIHAIKRLSFRQAFLK